MSRITRSAAPFSRIRFVLFGFSPSYHEQVKSKLVSVGGVDVGEYKPDCTHVIVHNMVHGGMFVFNGKQLLYARKDEGTGDHALLDDVLDVCCKVPVA